MKNNLENFTQTNTLKNSITQTITDTGDIVNDLINAIINETDIDFNRNTKIFGNTNIIPLHCIIIWSEETPPYPNTNPISKEGSVLSYTINSTDCWYPCIGGTINVDGNNIDIPDLKGRMIVGYGNQFNTLGERTPGIIPLRAHNHGGSLGWENGHNHNNYIAVNPGSHCDWNQCRTFHKNAYNTSTKGHYSTKNFITGSHSPRYNDGSHNHNIHIHNASHNYGTNYYSKNVIPHSTIFQFWIRIR